MDVDIMMTISKWVPGGRRKRRYTEKPDCRWRLVGSRASEDCKAEYFNVDIVLRLVALNRWDHFCVILTRL